MKVFQIRQDDRFAWYETDQEQMERMVNKCSWQGRVLELAKDDAAQPVQQLAPVAADLAAFNAYFCNTLSCDGVESERQVEDCRVAAYDAWCAATRRAEAHTASAVEQEHYRVQGECEDRIGNLIADLNDARAALAAQVAAPVAMPAASVHDLEMQQYIGARLRRVATAAGVTVDYGDDEFYYVGAFSILGDIARVLEKTAASLQHDPLKCGTTRADRDAMRAAQPDSGRDAALEVNRYARCLAAISDLDRIGMQFAADLCHLPVVSASSKRNSDFLARQDVMDLVVKWRDAWTENSKARAPIDRDYLAAHPANVAQVGRLETKEELHSRATEAAVAWLMTESNGRHDPRSMHDVVKGVFTEHIDKWRAARFPGLADYVASSKPASDAELVGYIDADAVAQAKGGKDAKVTIYTLPRLAAGLDVAIYTAPPANVAQPLKPMGEEGNEWYFDCDGHYIDVKRDAAGKYSVYFRNQKDGSETYSDQAAANVAQVGELSDAALVSELHAAHRYYGDPGTEWLDLARRAAARITAMSAPAKTDKESDAQIPTYKTIDLSMHPRNPEYAAIKKDLSTLPPLPEPRKFQYMVSNGKREFLFYDEGQMLRFGINAQCAAPAVLTDAEIPASPDPVAETSGGVFSLDFPDIALTSTKKGPTT